ncbi:MAG: radical SAM protein [Desulfobacterales bacterium]
MECYRLDNFAITIDKHGADRFTKASYPVRYGRYGEIKTADYLFEFNLNGEIKTIRGLNGNWPHPAEWLKRTAANDWVFYSVGRYHRLFSFLGEYYLPCLSYPNNSPWAYNPFGDVNIQNALAAAYRLQEDLHPILAKGIPTGVKDYLGCVVKNDDRTLGRKTQKLHDILGTAVSVLPPDTRHVDYDVIPLMVADGCLYDCGFCYIKSRQRFQRRSQDNIDRQIRRLKHFYGDDLRNYNALFLGNHDALAAGREFIRHAATAAFEAFGFERAYLKNPTLFLFGSVDSLLNSGPRLLDTLNRTPFYTYINIGLESADAATLALIDKPLEREKIETAFQKMLDVNRHYLNIEVTANFLLGEHLPDAHRDALVDLIRSNLSRFYSKGAIYLSPLKTSRNRSRLLADFLEIKKKSRLPVYLYLIQRL